MIITERDCQNACATLIANDLSSSPRETRLILEHIGRRKASGKRLMQAALDLCRAGRLKPVNVLGGIMIAVAD